MDLNKQKNTVLGHCDWSIEQLKIIKNMLLGIKGEQNTIAESMGALMAVLVSHLIQISTVIFQDSGKGKTPNGDRDLQEIKAEFGNFIDRMIKK